MSKLTESELDEFCWQVVFGATHGMYSWYDYEMTPEEEWEDHMNEGEKGYMRGRGTAHLDMADALYTLDVDVGFRALTHAEEEDVNLYPAWVNDSEYEPHFRLSSSTPPTYRVVSEEDEDKWENS